MHLGGSFHWYGSFVQMNRARVERVSFVGASSAPTATRCRAPASGLSRRLLRRLRVLLPRAMFFRRPLGLPTRMGASSFRGCRRVPFCSPPSRPAIQHRVSHRRTPFLHLRAGSRCDWPMVKRTTARTSRWRVGITRGSCTRRNGRSDAGCRGTGECRSGIRQGGVDLFPPPLLRASPTTWGGSGSTAWLRAPTSSARRSATSRQRIFPVTRGRTIQARRMPARHNLYLLEFRSR